MSLFQLKTVFSPRGDQPKAIESLSEAVLAGRKSQVLLGVTGSGKTFTMANVIEKVQRPTLILAHNKTLAAQLFQEFKAFFPNNAVEYFVSYYDYYQPEAYIARTDTYIEKDMSINDQIDKMRLSATRSLLEREDVIIVASVSCIYGLGSAEFFRGMNLVLSIGAEVRRDDVLLHLVEMQYQRNDYDFSRATFRVRGDCLDIFPAYEDDVAYRVEFFGDEVERILQIDPLTGKPVGRQDTITIYPSSHHVTPEQVREAAQITIKEELKERRKFFEENNRLIEAQRIHERTMHDLEMIKEVGFCKGIENYSRHFSGREPESAPQCLLNYFPENYLLFVDESHQTIPQLRAMYNGDKARKDSLVEFGFRLPSAYDNRPLKFEETYALFHQVIYVSATPAPWEVGESGGEIVEQLIRPTGLLDPEITVKPAQNQVDDCLEEIRREIDSGGRVLVTTLTKRLSEDLTNWLLEIGVKTKYLHSDIDTIERMQIIGQLRQGEFDVLVGINLLREGLDIPEVSLVAILDADKEGFLRSETSLIQTCGRAARNEKGRVVMYADTMTKSIQKTLQTTQERRKVQMAYNKKHGITPKSVKREINPLVEEVEEIEKLSGSDTHISCLSADEVEKKIKELEKQMKHAAHEMDFEQAVLFRDEMRKYQKIAIDLGG